MAYTPDSQITTWVDSIETQTNLNYIAPSQFVFTMSRLRDVAFSCQSANIPNISLGESTQFTRVRDISVPGDKVTFGQLLVTFLVDENMTNYKSLYDWMRQIGKGVDTDEYNEYINSQRARFPTQVDQKPVPISPTMTDATLTIIDSNNNANVEIQFKDLFPISLEAIQFDLTDTAYTYLTAAASFSFKYYDIVKV